MSTLTTRPRYLSVAQSATLKSAGIKPGATLDPADKSVAAIAATMGIRPGRYTVARYVVKSGANEGKKAFTLTPADDVTALTLAAATAAATAARWDDKGWVKGQRDAARVKASDAAAALAAAQGPGKPGKGKGKGKGKPGKR